MALIDLGRRRGQTFARTERVFGAIAEWNDRRRTYKELASLSERELDDIGISRADIDRMSRRPRA